MKHRHTAHGNRTIVTLPKAEVARVSAAAIRLLEQRIVRLDPREKARRKRQAFNASWLVRLLPMLRRSVDLPPEFGAGANSRDADAFDHAVLLGWLDAARRCAAAAADERYVRTADVIDEDWRVTVKVARRAIGAGD